VCGICGIIHLQPERPVDRDLLQSINDTMIHRGADDAWYHLESGMGLAMRLLAINHPSGERRSMSNEDGSIWVALDGEIYNYTELRRYLAAKGHAFQSASASELLTHLYEEEGGGFPESLKGVFAIALWDKVNRRLLLIRDRLGVKPLYMAYVGGTLVFTSELGAVMQHPEVSREIDLMGFSEFLTFGHSIPPRTILAPIQKLPAGHMATYEHGMLTMHQYWDLLFPEEASKDLNEELHVERFREAFARATKRCLMRGVPVGVSLSGGMDTSSIVAMMSHLGVPTVHTYAGGYQGFDSRDPSGELGRARTVAEYFNTHHNEMVFSSQDYVDSLPRCIKYMDDPVADEASPVRMLIAGQARRDVAVILGGEGGDDVAGGYGWDSFQKRFDRIRRFQRLPQWLRQSAPHLVGPFLPRKLREWLARGNRDISTINAEEHYSMVWAFGAEEKRRYCPILHDVQDHCHDLLREMYARSGTADPLCQATYVFVKTWVSESMLMSTDKMNMSYGVEYRAPFLDHELVELSARIPSRYKVRREENGTYTTKSILRRAMRGILPGEVIDAPKFPFLNITSDDWLHSVMIGNLGGVLLSDNARSSGYYDIKNVESLLERYRHLPTLESMLQIRHLLFFEMWRQLVLDRCEGSGALDWSAI
jgi:asparagine synthase (glutamine-hydrolysing)